MGKNPLEFGTGNSGIKTPDPYLDFEPLLWYERKLNAQLLTKVWMTPYKEKFDKRLIEFGIKFNAISKDLAIFDWDKPFTGFEEC